MSNGKVDGSLRVENCIGFAQVPLGIAGPLNINGQHQKGSFYAPLATVEPTLVASCSRGCKALQKSGKGGVRVAAMTEGLSRAPLFRFKTVDQAVSFYQDLHLFENTFRVHAERTSRFARLIRLTPHLIGPNVHVKFDYHCGDAAGQNMVSIATHAACVAFLQASAQDLGIIDFRIEGNFSSDKKLSWGNVREPRGVQVNVWATVTDEASRSVLGVSSKRIHETIEWGKDGAIRNGQQGVNGNTANIIAAMFIACGQDAASVLESGWSHITSEYDEGTGDLTLSLFIPSLLVGTVGGGTSYKTQREALELLNCYGQGKKWAFAETVAAFALALDLSTISAVANDTFTAAHLKLARL